MNSSKLNVVSRFELGELWDAFSEREQKRVEATLACVPPGIRSVLDAGCGDGRFLHLVAGIAERAVGVDPYLEPLRRVRVPHLQGSITNLPFSSNAFDLVVATEVLEHLSESEFRSAFHEMSRVSRQFVMITVPYRENLAEEICLCEKCGRQFHKYGHMKSFTKADLESVDGSLAVEHIGTIVPIRKTRYFSFLYWLQHQVGGTYNSDPNTRCPSCGSCTQENKGNSLGFLIQHLIWRIDKHFPKTEDGWIVAVYRKQLKTT